MKMSARVVTPEEKACARSSTSEVYVSTSDAETTAPAAMPISELSTQLRRIAGIPAFVPVAVPENER